MSTPKHLGERPNDFYAVRYSSERQKLRDAVFAQVYEGYFGQSSWVSTADYDRFTAWLELGSESRLLDVACGAGHPALRTASRTGSTVTGIDSSAQAIETANELAHLQGASSRVQFVCADASQPLPFPAASFDALICIDALAHLPDRRTTFAEWARVLRPAGRLVFTSQVLTGLISNHELSARTPFGYYAIGPEGYDERLLGEMGFLLRQRVDLTPTFVQIAERHCAARAQHKEALRSTEGEEEFQLQNLYRSIGAQLAREKRLSHFAFLATQSVAPDAI